MKKNYVLIGNYGSGKTEVAMNIAFNAAAQGKKVELVDLDLVNTYFRLSERRDLISDKKIKLVSPNFSCSNIETLSLPAEVQSAFDQDWDVVVFDVGGDPTGATALGRYKQNFMELPEGSLEVLNVVNVRRPMAGTAEKIISLMQDMAAYSRLKVTGFVNNTNLAERTSGEELIAGYEILREASVKTGIPVLYTCGTQELLDEFLAGNPDPKYVGTPFAIKRHMRRDWYSFTRKGL